MYSVITLDDFGLGIERRAGGVTSDFRHAADIINYTITPGRKLIRRPPCEKVSGQLDEQTQGFLVWNDKIYTVAPAGTTVQHTLDLPVETLFFDVPLGCRSDAWTLLDLQGTPAGIVALIQHHASSLVAPLRNFLHVWDQQRPTFVWDHACPTTWSPALPEGLIGERVPKNEYREFDQVMTLLAGRVFLSRPDGNVAFSAVNRPRVWSTRTLEHVLQHGEWWYWVGTHEPDQFERILPIPYPELILDQYYAAYVLEYFDAAEQRWVQIEENALLLSSNQYCIQEAPNPWEPSKSGVKLVVNFANPDGVVFRFRTFVRPTMHVLSGLYVAPPRHVVGGLVAHENGSHTVSSFQTSELLTPGAPYMIVCPHPAAPIAIPTAILAAPGSMPLNGQQRFWSRIIAHVSADTTGDFVYALTGSVSVEAGRQTVSGTGTAFLAEVLVGDTIVINDERKVVRAVLSDTILEVDTPFTQTYSGVGLRDPTYTYAADLERGNEWYAAKISEIVPRVGADDAGYLATAAYASAGDHPVLLSGWTNVLLVQYPFKLQAWNIESYDSLALLAQYADTAHVFPAAVEVDEELAVLTSRGVKLFQLTGAEKNYITAHSIMDRLRGLPQPNYGVLGWWPTQRLLLATATSPDHMYAPQQTQLLVFHYFVQEEIAAWTRWVIVGLPAVELMAEFHDTLLLVYGREVWRLLPVRSGYVAHDFSGPFTSALVTLPCDFGVPHTFKKLLRCDISQRGSCALHVYVNASEPDPAVLGPPYISGITHGRQRIPVMVLGSTLSLWLETIDDQPHELDQIILEYTLKGR